MSAQPQNTNKVASSTQPAPQDKAAHDKKRKKKNKLAKARNVFALDVGRKYSVPHQLFGLMMFIIVFVVIIPTTAYKNGHIDFLAAYLPNLDLMANVMSYHGGPTTSDFISELYPPSPTTTYGFLSQSLINWMALMGLTFLVAEETLKTGDLYTGWSLGFAMIFITYLLPGQLISGAMDKVYDFLEKKSGMPIFESPHGHATWNVVVLVGMIVSFIVIKFEEKLIKFLRYEGVLRHLAVFIIDFPKRFTKSKKIKRRG